MQLKINVSSNQVLIVADATYIKSTTETVQLFSLQVPPRHTLLSCLSGLLGPVGAFLSASSPGHSPALGYARRRYRMVGGEAVSAPVGYHQLRSFRPIQRTRRKSSGPLPASLPTRMNWRAMETRRLSQGHSEKLGPTLMILGLKLTHWLTPIHQLLFQEKAAGN